MAHFATRRLAFALLASGVLLGAASQARAHAHLLGATPASNAVVPAGTRTVALTFSEPLTARFSGLEVTAANRAKVAMVPVSVDPEARKSLTAAFKAPLSAGTYTVTWHVVSADTHRMQGSYSFTVR